MKRVGEAAGEFDRSGSDLSDARSGSRVSGPGVAGRVSFRYDSPESLFRSHFEPLARALTLLAGDRELACDAVQDAFAKLLTNWSKVREYDDQVSWVRRVALNRVLDHQRSLRRQPRLLLRLRGGEPPDPQGLGGDPALWQAVQRLPPKQRAAVALFYVADLSVAEVADVMAVSEGTVKRHLDRGRETLRTILKAGGR